MQFRDHKLAGFELDPSLGTSFRSELGCTRALLPPFGVGRPGSFMRGSGPIPEEPAFEGPSHEYGDTTSPFRRFDRASGRPSPPCAWRLVVVVFGILAVLATWHALTVDAIRNDFDEVVRLGADGIPLTGLNDEEGISFAGYYCHQQRR